MGSRNCTIVVLARAVETTPDRLLLPPK